jgi:hypothetical protein
MRHSYSKFFLIIFFAVLITNVFLFNFAKALILDDFCQSLNISRCGFYQKADWPMGCAVLLFAIITSANK